MSVFDYFRNFFGFSQRPSGRGTNREDNLPGERPNDFRNPIWSTDEDDDDDDFRSRPRDRFGFSVDSDPFEMHRFFEQQLDEILRRFQDFGFGRSLDDGGFGSFFGGFEEPKALPEPPSESTPLWKQYLKPGYRPRSNSNEENSMQDSDLDGKIFPGEVDKFLKGPLEDAPANPRHEGFLKPDYPLAKRDDFLARPGTSTQVFGQSVMSKTVRRSDGSVEHHRTVRDNKGNEETTVTRKIGDQSYSVTTKTKPNGEQECIKNFINVDEDHIEDFEKKWGSKL